ncbi:hypothetical protein [Streptomyces chartreusis]|uniref:hypothetical protein n=1 Tax=Streptomyces chartreusis TaxID=1969 RepID=UPI0036A86BC8
MREHILLYLLAHMSSSVVATGMLRKWFFEVTNPWLRTGVVCLQLGFASGVIFDILKLFAIGARWSGTDWDRLSTFVAPLFAHAAPDGLAEDEKLGLAGAFTIRAALQAHRAGKPASTRRSNVLCALVELAVEVGGQDPQGVVDALAAQDEAELQWHPQTEAGSSSGQRQTVDLPL